MSEVLVIARFVARKGKEEQLKALLQSMLTPTRAELGCNAYELYESNSSERFYLYENWESRSALEQHKATPHFGRLEKAVGELLIEPFEVNVLRAILPGTTTAA